MGVLRRDRMSLGPGGASGDGSTAGCTAELTCGAVRIGRSVADVMERLRPGDIAVIDVPDLHVADANHLIAGRPAAVIDISTSTTARGTGQGARRLVTAGVLLIDQTGPGLWRSLTEGDSITVDPRSGLLRDSHSRVIGSGVVRQDPSVTTDPQTLPTRLSQLLLDAAHLITTQDEISSRSLQDVVGSSRPVLLVGPAADRHELQAIRRWIGDSTPVVVTAGSGAATWGRARRRAPAPDLIVCDNAEQLAQVPRSWRPGLVLGPTAVSDRARTLGMDSQESEDGVDATVLALRLLGDTRSATVVTVGVPTTPAEMVGLPREDAARLLAAVVTLGERWVPTPPARHRPSLSFGPSGRGSRLATVAVSVSAAAAGLAILLLSDPGLALVHRMLPGWHP